MKIVIEIPDIDYETIEIFGKFTSHYSMHDIIKIIKNGTPLPKNHGRLIDADALNRRDINLANVPMNFIDTAPTIIEAFNTESEDKDD